MSYRDLYPDLVLYLPEFVKGQMSWSEQFVIGRGMVRDLVGGGVFSTGQRLLRAAVLG